MPIDTLLEEHRLITEVLDGVVEIDTSSLSRDALVQAQLAFLCEAMEHLANDDRLVLLPLMADRRPLVAMLAARSRTQLRELHDDIEAHVLKWQDIPAAWQWPSFHRNAEALLRRLHARHRAEEKGIYRLLPVLPVARPRIPSAQSPWDNLIRREMPEYAAARG